MHYLLPFFTADNPSGLDDNTVVDRIEQANEGKSFFFLHIHSTDAAVKVLPLMDETRSFCKISNNFAPNVAMAICNFST